MYNPTKILRYITFAKPRIRMFIRPSYGQYQDIVKELYLRELKNCKPFVIKSNDSEGQVKAWKLPDAPKVPEIDINIDEELKVYEKEVETETSVLSDAKDPLDELFEKEEESMNH
ncbi:hypothetical protein PNEG_00988 [Pneumocystis murina B123]|uniref:Uncharacterized protein n=1 Tax=Pneumocystis murina (strain B123) TaxID=1069680 RepID=M7NU83_PNEMU|nr:hypothetical protein PNEG_00988 [Pneumocystis murina B123]EMR10842.1 hypothetical protein PNEG_00988 [Pneumocystis murina B123]